MKHDGKVEGEGTYKGTKDYNQRTKKFIDAGKVDAAAKEAEPRSPEEAREMEQAERAGKKHAKR